MEEQKYSKDLRDKEVRERELKEKDELKKKYD